MTTASPILGLTLYNSTTDQAEFFSSFRANIAGVGSTSNFYKIDTAYGVQANQITDLQNRSGSVYVPCVFVSSNYYEANSITEITSLITNMTIIVKLDTTSAGTVTLNINALGTKSLMKINSSGTIVNIASGELMIGKNYLFRYDGTQWIWVSSNSADQIFVSGTAGNFLKINTDNTIVDSTYTNTSFTTADTTTPYDGWIPSASTWSYSSADSPTFVISINADMTAKISVGMRIKLTQTTVKYFIVTAVGTYGAGVTLITVYGGTDYTLANAAITSPYYSGVKIPFGFNPGPSKWSVSLSSDTTYTKSAPTANVYYSDSGLGSCPTIDIPIGVWNVKFQAQAQSSFTIAAATSMGVRVGLSYASGSQPSDSQLFGLYLVASPIITGGYVRVMVVLNSVIDNPITKKTGYPCIATGNSGVTSIDIVGFLRVVAVCAYL